MAGFSDTFENDVLLLIFEAVAIANIADNAGTSPLTQLWVALHTADPTDAGTQDNNEVTTGQHDTYARQAVTRATTGDPRFDVVGDTATLTANLDFPAGTGGTGGTVTHFSVGVASSGATKILGSGAVTPNLTLGNGSTPRLTTGTTITLD